MGAGGDCCVPEKSAMTLQAILLLGLGITILALFAMLVMIVIKGLLRRDSLTIQDVLKELAEADANDDAGK
jgi:hypothetical protein